MRAKGVKHVRIDRRTADKHRKHPPLTHSLITDSLSHLSNPPPSLPLHNAAASVVVAVFLRQLLDALALYFVAVAVVVAIISPLKPDDDTLVAAAVALF